MRHLNLTLYLICCVGATEAIGQDNTQIPIPSTPAFGILNFEPAAIMRPTNNKDFGADLLNSFDARGRLLTNIGLEVTPYWLKNRPALKEAEYLKPTFRQGFVQSLNFSAATVKDSASGNSKLGVGIRFKLLQGEPLDEFYQKKNELKNEETVVSLINAARALIGVSVNSRMQAIDFIVSGLKNSGVNVNSNYINKFRDDALRRSVQFEDSPSGINNFIEALKNDKIDANGDLVSQFVELSKKRKGLTLELAGASSFYNSGNSQNLERIGIWLNASSYITSTDAWAFSGRYLLSNSDSALTNFDLGLSYTKEHASFNISVESMLRWCRADIPDFKSQNKFIKRTYKDFTYRIAALASHKISNDISINLSLGKNFDSPFISGAGFFSILGFNYSIFSKQEIELN